MGFREDNCWEIGCWDWPIVLHPSSRTSKERVTCLRVSGFEATSFGLIFHTTPCDDCSWDLGIEVGLKGRDGPNNVSRLRSMHSIQIFQGLAPSLHSTKDGFSQRQKGRREGESEEDLSHCNFKKLLEGQDRQERQPSAGSGGSSGCPVWEGGQGGSWVSGV